MMEASAITLKRIRVTELKDIPVLQKLGIEIYYPDPEDICHLRVGFLGPEGTPYEGGWFIIDYEYDRASTPFRPPKLKFLTPIYHPNISEDGKISLDILSYNWSPALTMAKVIMSIMSLLNDPNADDPINLEAGMLYNSDNATFEQIARDNTLTHCSNI